VTFQKLLDGPIQRCLINEPVSLINEIDFVIDDFEVPVLTATEKALRRWFKREKDHERG
jgi:hypothetical protein